MAQSHLHLMVSCLSTTSQSSSFSIYAMGSEMLIYDSFFRHQIIPCHPVTMAAQIGAPALPRPTHYVFRPDGTIAPLVAVDELPEHVQISGVPPLLSPADTQGLTSLGVVPRAGSVYIVETMAEVPAGSIKSEDSVVGEVVEPVVNPVDNWRRAIAPPEVRLLYLDIFAEHANVVCQSKAGDGSVVSASPSLVARTRASVSVVNFSPSSLARPPTRGPISTIASPSARGPHSLRAGAYPGGNPYQPVVPGKFKEKVYCTHWIRTGSCDFIQQGCIYKHEVPSFEALREIGFLEWPRWIRERGGVTEFGETDNDRRRRLQMEREARGANQPPIGSFGNRLHSMDQAPMYGRPGPDSTFGGSQRARASFRGWRGGYSNQPGHETAFLYGQFGQPAEYPPYYGGHWGPPYQRGTQRGNMAYTAPYRGQGFRASPFHTNAWVNFPVRQAPANRGTRVTEIVETSDAKTTAQSSDKASSGSVATEKAEAKKETKAPTSAEDNAAKEEKTLEATAASSPATILASTTTMTILARPTTEAQSPAQFLPLTLPPLRDPHAGEMNASARREEDYAARRAEMATRQDPAVVSFGPPGQNEPSSSRTNHSLRREDAPAAPQTPSTPQSGDKPSKQSAYRAYSHASSSTAPLKGHPALQPTPVNILDMFAKAKAAMPQPPAKPVPRDLYDGLPAAPEIVHPRRFVAPDTQAVLGTGPNIIREAKNLAAQTSKRGRGGRGNHTGTSRGGRGHRSHASTPGQAAAIAGWQAASTGGIVQGDRQKFDTGKKAAEEAQKQADFGKWKMETLWKEKVAAGDKMVVKKGVLTVESGGPSSSTAALPLRPAYRAPDAEVPAASSTPAPLSADAPAFVPTSPPPTIDFSPARPCAVSERTVAASAPTTSAPPTPAKQRDEEAPLIDLRSVAGSVAGSVLDEKK